MKGISNAAARRLSEENGLDGAIMIALIGNSYKIVSHGVTVAFRRRQRSQVRILPSAPTWRIRFHRGFHRGEEENYYEYRFRDEGDQAIFPVRVVHLYGRTRRSV